MSKQYQFIRALATSPQFGVENTVESKSNSALQ